MEKDRSRQLLREAKHSLLVLTSFGGQENPVLGLLAYKWVDLAASLVEQDDKAIERDFRILICQPISIVAEALARRAQAEGPLEEIQASLKADGEIIETKRNLICICNTQIFKLNQAGCDLQYVEELR